MALPQEISKNDLLEKFDTFVFDADGVLWTGDVPVPGAADWINCLLKTPGKRVFVATNNATKTLDLYMEKVTKMGFGGLSPQNLVSPAIVLADYFKRNPEKFAGQSVYLVGTPNLKTTLETEGGVECFGIGEDLSRDYTNTDFIYEVDVSRKVKAVVVSFDLHFSYAKLMKVANYLQDPEVEFLPTNGDNTFPGPVKNMILPENGPWIAAIEAASGRKPTAIFGKPHKAMADFLKSRAGNIDPSRTIMFGDRLDTDMMFGNTNGFSTCWMQTGVNTVKDIAKARENNEQTKIPNYTCTFAKFTY